MQSSRDVTNPKSFSCPICFTTFTQECHLNVHIVAVHVGLKPHKCQICSEAYIRKSELEKHISATGHVTNIGN